MPVGCVRDTRIDGTRCLCATRLQVRASDKCNAYDHSLIHELTLDGMAQGEHLVKERLIPSMLARNAIEDQLKRLQRRIGRSHVKQATAHRNVT
jgi:hypothetical protein